MTNGALYITPDAPHTPYTTARIESKCAWASAKHVNGSEPAESNQGSSVRHDVFKECECNRYRNQTKKAAVMNRCKMRTLAAQAHLGGTYE